MSQVTTTDVLTVDQIRAQVACERVFVAFHVNIDEGHATRSIELFTDDGVFEVRGERHEGIDAIRAFLERREANTARLTRHLASNFRFQLDDEDHAHATANMTLYSRDGDSEAAGAPGEPGFEAVVDCQVTFLRQSNGEWRMGLRRHSRFAATR